MAVLGGVGGSGVLRGSFGGLVMCLVRCILDFCKNPKKCLIRGSICSVWGVGSRPGRHTGLDLRVA